SPNLTLSEVDDDQLRAAITIPAISAAAPQTATTDSDGTSRCTNPRIEYSSDGCVCTRRGSRISSHSSAKYRIIVCDPVAIQATAICAATAVAAPPTTRHCRVTTSTTANKMPSCGL